MEKTEIEEKGYTYIKEYNDNPRHRFAAPINGIIVWKDGFYGFLNSVTGEELTPCVHLSEHDAIMDICVINPKSKDINMIKQIGIQKILKDTLGESYDLYIGSVVRIMFEILALPNSVCDHEEFYLKPLQEPECIKTALAIYRSIDQIMKSGGKQFVIYDLFHNAEEFSKYLKELERMINGDLLYRVRYERETLTEEEKKQIKEDSSFEEKRRKYVKLEPEIFQTIEFTRFKLNPMSVLYNEKSEILSRRQSQRPVIEISSEKTIYYKDTRKKDEEYYEIYPEDYRKGVSLENSDEPKTF